MRRAFLILFMLVAASVQTMADPAVAAAQETLKSQGFYYGQITGQKDADTIAAIRRFQIRNGLKVSGDLDAETKKSLSLGTTGTNRKAPAPTPAPRPRGQVQEEEPTGDEEDLEGSEDEQGGSSGPGSRRMEEEEGEEAVEEEGVMGPGPNVYGGLPTGPPVQFRGLFEGTPYEMAPPAVQHQVITGAQFQLARRGIYRNGVDGVFGPGTEFALRAFQSQSGLAQTGRLDIDTLAALRLLPQQRRNAFGGPRHRYPRVAPNTILRGEWVR